jgi:hypothetical protein
LATIFHPLKIFLKTMNIKNWTVSEVLNWLGSLKIFSEPQVIIDSFKENVIDGASLFTLTNQELKDDLKVFKLGERKKLYKK